MSSFSEVFSYTAFVHAIAGATGGSIVMTTFYPLEVLRTHKQVNKGFSLMKFIADEGIDALYKGLQATLISLYISNFVYFYANNLLKVFVKRLTQAEISIPQNLLIASLAGVVNVLITCPFYVANTRLKLQSKNVSTEKKYDGLFDCIYKIATKEGVPTLWSGLGTSLLLVTNPTINWVVYDKVKSIMVKNAHKGGRKLLTPLEIFVAGAIAKTIATIISYPAQFAQIVQRSGRHGGHGHAGPGSQGGKGGQSAQAGKGGQGRDGEKAEAEAEKKKKMSFLEILRDTYKHDGFLGWFRGLREKLLQTVLMAAFHFWCYEQIKFVIFHVLKPSRK